MLSVGRFWYFIGLLLFVVACSRTPVIPTPIPETDTPDPTAVPSPTPAPTARPTDTPLPILPTVTNRPLLTIAEYLSQDGRFSTLRTAFKQANLDDALGDPGPFTLFAPTNDAFATLPPGVLDNFLADPKGDLSDLVLYHVVNGHLPAQTLRTLTTITTAHGDNVTIQPVGTDQIQLNQRVAVTVTDITAANGVIHIIDSVLIPASTLGSIVEIASNDAQFTTFLAALQAADLVDILEREGPYTIFAPSDAAFASLPPGALASLLADPSGALTDALFAHVIEGQISSQDLAQLGQITTVSGDPLSISRTNGAITLNEDVHFTSSDILASNGVVHVVDTVLLPTLPSIADLLQLDPQFSSLLAALETADLLSLLDQPGTQTLLAPTNDAFATLPPHLQQFWETADSTQTERILRYHLLDGLLSTEDLASSSSLATLSEATITVSDGPRFNGEAMLTETVYLASNGIIRAIDHVLLPPQDS